LLLLDTHESVNALILRLEHIIAEALCFFRTAAPRVQGNIAPQQWVLIYDDLGNVERDLEQMVARLQLDRTLLFSAYHRLQTIAQVWLTHREHNYLQALARRLPLDMKDEEAFSRERRKTIDDDKALLQDVITKIKHLLVAAR
jgi:hypothetical protein